MTMQTILILESVFFGIALIFALVDFRKIAEKWTAYNPTRATVYVRSGQHDEPCRGKLIYNGMLGAFYGYTWHKVKLVVAIDKDYPDIEIHGRRKISVRAGHAISVSELFELLNPRRKEGAASGELEAQRLCGAEDISLAASQNTQSAFDLNALVESHIAVEGINSLFGARVKGWAIAIMIVGALVAGYFLFQQFGPSEPTVVPATTTPITITPTSGTIIPGG